jgi:hypothetical protein
MFILTLVVLSFALRIVAGVKAVAMFPENSLVIWLFHIGR